MARIEHDQNESLLGSLRIKVFNQLHNDILNGVYQNGDSLIETRLSEEMGVSRTPIREAIRQLELEGLVQLVPNKGALVVGVSDKDVEDIYTIRMLIEGLAARWATEKISDVEFKELNEALELEEFYTAKNDIAHLMKFDSDFHEIIYKASKSIPLMHTLKNFHQYVQKARNASMSSPGRALEVLNEHKAILSAIADRNPELAERLATEHVQKASLSFLKQKNNT